MARSTETDFGRQLALFELDMLGGATERRYRLARPEIESMPWGTIDQSAYPDAVTEEARRSWTTAAFQEHRTAAACATTIRALVEARAPIDLIAGFARFPLDELVHVELCARMAMELGGAVELWHEPWALAADADETLSPLMRACELVVRNFCVGESLSIPLLHGAWIHAAHPLSRAIMGRIVKDEAAHGVIGWTFLDWALPRLPPGGRDLVARVALAAIRDIHGLWDELRRRPYAPTGAAHALGRMSSIQYLALADRSMRSRVLRPFAARGFDLATELLRRSPDISRDAAQPRVADGPGPRFRSEPDR